MVACIRDKDFRRTGDADNRHGVAGVHGIDNFERTLAGFVETCARAAGIRRIGSVHAGGCVEQEGDLSGGDGGNDDERTREREHQQRENDELQEQEQVTAQALPRGVRFAILKQLLPEEGAGDGDFASAQAQHVEQDDGNCQ